MFHLWKVPPDTKAKELLNILRWEIAFFTIEVAIMAFVLIRTYWNSKFPYLYTCAAMMFLSSLFGLIGSILLNWYIGCGSYWELNEKCHGEPSKEWKENVELFHLICGACIEVFYFIGHFLFAYRYFEVAEMFGR
jgi:hypothetical protein